MKGLGYAIRRWWFRRFHKTVRIGWITANQAYKSNDLSRLGIGVGLIAYGLVKGRSERRLVYKTSIDAGQGTTIRVMRGRHPIAETAPLP